MKLKVGVLGLGGAGRAHAQRFLRNKSVEQVFGFDIRPVDIEKLNVCESRDEFFDSVDVVSICTPDHEHCSDIIESLRRGKHVLVEKPMVISSAEAERVVLEEGRHPDLVVAVHHQMRFNPAFERAKELKQSGTLGRIFSVDAQYWHDMRIRDGQFDDWRIEHGQSLLFGAASHPLDLVLDIVDSPLKGFQLYSNKIGYPDSRYEYTAVQLLLQFRDGTMGSIGVNSCCRFPQNNTLRILGEDATYEDGLLYSNGRFRVLEGYFRKDEPKNMVMATRSVAFGSILKVFYKAFRKIERIFLNLLGKWELIGLRRAPLSIYNHDYASQKLVDGFLERVCTGKGRIVSVEDGRRVIVLLEEMEERIRSAGRGG